MKITIESTETMIDMATAHVGSGQAGPARIWKGTTEDGVPVVAIVAGIATTLDAPDLPGLERQSDGNDETVGRALGLHGGIDARKVL